MNSIPKNMRTKLDSDIEKDIRNFLGKEGIDFLKESKKMVGSMWYTTLSYMVELEHK